MVGKGGVRVMEHGWVSLECGVGMVYLEHDVFFRRIKCCFEMFHQHLNAQLVKHHLNPILILRKVA